MMQGQTISPQAVLLILIPINGCRLYALKRGGIASYFLSKSGLLVFVIAKDCSACHCLILA
jgi:hypothetical protein